ncbi:MAG: hypothetical protein NTV09_04545 [Bacteroidetes bacterium]|nr:hypothetical protein [Bacteroidota bacterium]
MDKNILGGKIYAICLGKKKNGGIQRIALRASRHALWFFFLEFTGKIWVIHNTGTATEHT